MLDIKENVVYLYILVKNVNNGGENGEKKW